jgi:hypothetical protein
MKDYDFKKDYKFEDDFDNIKLYKTIDNKVRPLIKLREGVHLYTADNNSEWKH